MQKILSGVEIEINSDKLSRQLARQNYNVITATDVKQDIESDYEQILENIRGSILIVDDDKTIRNILSKFLKNEGYSTTTAEDGLTALNLIETRQFDVILLDMVMPAINGLEVLITLRLNHAISELPIIIISVTDDDAKVAELLNHGANDYIHKPIEAKVLLARVATQITLKRQINKYISNKFGLENIVAKKTRELSEAIAILEKERERFDQLFMTSPAITYMADVPGNLDIAYVSKNVTRIFGYSLEQVYTNGFWARHVHPLDIAVTRKTIQANIGRGSGSVEYRFQNSKGEYHWILDQHAVKSDSDTPIKIVGSWIDISAQKKLTKYINYKSSHDERTGLINRQEFDKRIQYLLNDSSPQQVQHVLCYLDLDQFEVINNSLGQVAGNQCLVQVSQLFNKSISKRDLLAYLGADKYGVIFHHCSIDHALKLLDKVTSILNQYRFIWGGTKHVITASVGVVAINRDMDLQADVLNLAVSACNLAKNSGRDKVHVYSESDTRILSRKNEMLWVEKVTSALEDDRFLLFYQPIIPLSKDVSDTHFELLIRMKDEKGSLIYPGLFLPAVERYNLSVKLDQWVIHTAFSWLQAHSEYLEENHSWGINISGQSLGDLNLLPFVFDQFECRKIPYHKIYFEITETAVISNYENAIKFITALKNKGCKFALDDFGSGLSSFAYLKNLPVNYLKIDGSFVKDMANNNVDFLIVDAINQVSQSMDIKTIAEFVESNAIIEKLKILGVNYAQGYGIAKPDSLHDFRKI